MLPYPYGRQTIGEPFPESPLEIVVTVAALTSRIKYRCLLHDGETL